MNTEFQASDIKRMAEVDKWVAQAPQRARMLVIYWEADNKSGHSTVDPTRLRWELDCFLRGGYLIKGVSAL